MRQIPLRDCRPLAQLCGSHPQICSTMDAPCCRYMASSNSPFSYYRLREWRQTTEQASSRRKALWWDVFSSGDRKRALQTVLNHSVLGRLPLAGPGSLWHLMRPDGPLPLPPNTTYMPPSLTRAQRRRTGVPSAAASIAPSHDAVCPSTSHWVHMEGVTYSMRLKNILLCGSLAVWVNSPPDRYRYREYWHTLLEPLTEHVWMLNTSALDPSNFVIGQRAKRMAARAADLATEVLSPSNILLYLQLFLRSYAKLQRINHLNESSAEQAGFLQVTRASLARFCTCASQACFDSHNHFVAECRPPIRSGYQKAEMSGDVLYAPAPEINCMRATVPDYIRSDANFLAKVMKWCDCKLECNWDNDRNNCSNSPLAAHAYPSGVCTQPLLKGYPYRVPGHFLNDAAQASCWKGRNASRASP